MKFSDTISIVLGIGLFHPKPANASRLTHGGVRGAATAAGAEENHRVLTTFNEPACVQTLCEEGSCAKDYSDCGGLFQLLLKTDDYPEETSWHLTQDDPSTGDEVGVIVSRDPGSYTHENGSRLYNKFASLNGTGCYTFTIFDDDNDGICCYWGKGYYRVKYDGVQVAAGAEFGQSAKHHFGSNCWREMFTENFENGFGKFKDGGEDAKIIETYYYGNATEGKSLRLRDSGKTAKATTAEYNVGHYSAVRIDFYFMTRLFEANERFVLEYMTDGTGEWQDAGIWVKGTDFDNNQWLNEAVTVTFDESDNIQLFKFRFRCKANGNNDLLYIDNVKFEGLSK